MTGIQKVSAKGIQERDEKETDEDDCPSRPHDDDVRDWRLG